MGVAVCVLGPVAVGHHGHQTQVRSSRASSLLATLAVNGTAWTAEHVLIAQLWDGGPPRTARQQLHSTVSRLRTQFGCVSKGLDWLQSRQHGYRLAPEVSVDAVSFCRDVADGQALLRIGDTQQAELTLTRAVDRWLGSFAGGATQRAISLGAHLDEMRRETLRELAALDARGGRHHVAIDRLHAILAEDPYDELAAALLAIALARHGHRGDAVAVCRLTASRLRQDLAIEPGPELQGAFAQIVNGHGRSALNSTPQRQRAGRPASPAGTRPSDPGSAEGILRAIVGVASALPPESRWALRQMLAAAEPSGAANGPPVV